MCMWMCMCCKRLGTHGTCLGTGELPEDWDKDLKDGLLCSCVVAQRCETVCPNFARF